MFNLIVTIVSISLIVVVAIATVYYGGDSYSEGKIEAEAARYRNEAAQISGAVKLYVAQGNMTGESFTLQELVDDKWLKSIPEGWEPGDNKIKRVLSADDEKSEHICYVANKQGGFEFPVTEDDVVAYSLNEEFGIPNCSKEGLDNAVPCCIE
jgi:hypothetical protein